MREIKFRAWDKVDCFFLPPQSLVMELSGQVWHGAKDFKMNKVVLQQFTGLLDKNFKEIYEGDFVEYTRLGYEKRQSGEVRWVDGCFVVVTDTWVSRGLMLEQKKLLALQSALDVEVISSIYENPELLTNQ